MLFIKANTYIHHVTTSCHAISYADTSFVNLLQDNDSTCINQFIESPEVCLVIILSEFKIGKSEIGFSRTLSQTSWIINQKELYLTT